MTGDGEVVQQLRLLRRADERRRFHLDHDITEAYEVDSMKPRESAFFVDDLTGHLRREWNADPRRRASSFARSASEDKLPGTARRAAAGLVTGESVTNLCLIRGCI